jgi:uncharacterized protein (TIGR03083 family)
MTLPRQEVVTGLQDELGRFEALIRSLGEDEWSAPTRCEGWSTGDVAAHVTGTLADIVNGRFDDLGTPEGTQRAVGERRGRTNKEVADELAEVAKQGTAIMASFDDAAWAGPAPTPVASSLGEGVEALWYDAFVHAEDIRAATGRPSEPGPGLKASVSHCADLLSQQAWGPATLVLDGQPEFAVSGGGGRRIEGDPLAFVLVATGRQDPATLGLDETVNLYRTP